MPFGIALLGSHSLFSFCLMTFPLKKQILFIMLKDDAACQRAEVMKTKSIFREMMLLLLGVMI